MRLRLHIQRHGLQPSPVIWTTGDSDSVKGAQNGTISQLLERVNDIIPLESDEWGLEDYIVEIHGYECLHFQEIESVFKDDDEVCIRPLLSTDLRARKFSGRHQISHAGRHLIDGVPFGRPFFRRAADRPIVQIPPRKRRRLIDDDEELDGADLRRQLTRQSGFVDINLDDDEDAQDEDFEISNDFDGDVLGGGDFDISQGGYGHGRNWGCKKRATETDNRGPELILSNGQALPLVERDGKPFPTYYNNALLDHFANSRSKSTQFPVIEGVGNVQEGSCDPKLSKAGTKSKGGFATKQSSFQSNLRGVLRSGKNVHFQDTRGRSINADAGLVALDDDESDNEEFQPDDSSDRTESDGGDGGGSEFSESNSETDSEISAQLSSSSSNERTESVPEEVSSRLSPKGPSERLRVSASTSDALPAVAKSPMAAEVSSRTIAPWMGRLSTRKRNQRRRNARKLTYLKRTGQLPQHATHADLRLWIQGALHVDPSAEAAGSRTVVAKRADTSLEAKRKELLASIASGEVEVGELEHQVETRETSKKTIKADESKLSDTSPPFATPTNAESITSTTRPRGKLDIASSRRMLFSSLGVKTPKTNEEEEKLRLNLAKSLSNDHRTRRRVNPGHNGVAQDQASSAPVVRSDADDLPTDRPDGGDNWKDKIALKAVECCYDGVRLSTPSFPFRQRWDPQQQGYLKRRKGKKRKRNRPQFYEDDAEYHSPLDENGNKSIGSEKAIQLNYDEPHEEGHTHDPQGRTNNDDIDGSSNQIMREPCGEAISAEAEDDLPALPADLSSLPELAWGLVQPGTVIAFKQLIISDDWEPKICDYRTAEVVNIRESVLELSLARRDIPTKDKKFDETGKRIWGKFEMPDADEETDPSLLRLPFSELIQPKLIQQPPQVGKPTIADDVMDGISGVVDPLLGRSPPEESNNERSSVEREIGWNYRTLSSPLDATRSRRDTVSRIESQMSEKIDGGHQSRSRLPGASEESKDAIDGARSATSHHSSNSSADNSREPLYQIGPNTERAGEDEHDVSQLIRDAGFGSTVVSLFLPFPSTKGYEMRDERKIFEDAASPAPISSPLMSPRFRGLSPIPVPEKPGLVELTETPNPGLGPATPFSINDQSSIHESLGEFDPTIASVGYPKLPQLGTSPRSPIDSDNHPNGGQMGDSRSIPSKELLPSSDAWVPVHQEESQRLPEVSPDKEDLLQDETSTNDLDSPLTGNNIDGVPAKAYSSSSDKDYPTVEELIASGRPSSQRVKEEEPSTVVGEKEDYTSKATATKPSNITPPIEQELSSPRESQLPAGPQTPGPIDLTGSSPTRDEADGDEDGLELPLGPGWVSKRRTTLGGINGKGRQKRPPRDVHYLD